jgi:hypothetical protein
MWRGPLLVMCIRWALICPTGFGALPHSAWAQAVPTDFKLRLVSSTVGPPETLADRAWVEIKAGGEATFSEMQGPIGRLPSAVVNLTRDHLAVIYQELTAERFFELQPLYRDPTIRGGDQAELTVTVNGRTHTVKTINIRVNAFDRITLVIDATLPAERRIQYNALHQKDYNEVER